MILAMDFSVAMLAFKNASDSSGNRAVTYRHVLLSSGDS
jgi:hypothetical protein